MWANDVQLNFSMSTKVVYQISGGHYVHKMVIRMIFFLFAGLRISSTGPAVDSAVSVVVSNVNGSAIYVLSIGCYIRNQA